MAAPTTTPLTVFVNRFLPRLKYPYLFLILGGLFLVDLVVPDPVPFIDEAFLAILTFVAASFRTRREDRPPPRDVTPADTEDLEISAGEGSGPPP